MSKDARILVAQEKSCIDIFVSALSSNYEIMPAVTLEEAERLSIEDGIDLFVIGIHFDDSRAIELCRFIRNDRKHSQTPVILVRYQPSDSALFLRQSIEVIAKVIGVKSYIEADYSPDDDDRPFFERVVGAIEEALPVG